jgi:hypothetical protein
MAPRNGRPPPPVPRGDDEHPSDRDPAAKSWLGARLGIYTLRCRLVDDISQSFHRRRMWQAHDLTDDDDDRQEPESHPGKFS